MQSTSSQYQRALMERSSWWDSISSISGTLFSAIWIGSSYFVQSAASLSCLVGDRYSKKNENGLGDDDWDQIDDFTLTKGVETNQPLDHQAFARQSKR